MKELAGVFLGLTQVELDKLVKDGELFTVGDDHE